MDFRGALRARLLADSAVTAIVGQRISWVERPQNGTLPAITLQVVSDPRPQHLKGFDAPRETRVQADCWANTYGAATAAAEAVIAAAVAPMEIDGISFSRAGIEGPRDLGEQTETGFVHRQSVDLIIRHRAV